jgi:N-6 DNA Methylase
VSDSATAFLNAAYQDLDLVTGELLDATDVPHAVGPEQWLDKGDWLKLAKKLNAEKLFFVENNPVIVFAKHSGHDIDSIRQRFNEIWCMARPMFLFLASEASLAVYDLARAPVRTQSEWYASAPELNVARSIQAVVTELHQYRREQIESGKLFEDERFGDTQFRADYSLISNLRTVRADLRREGLDGDDLRYAHALIGRSVFIRYLEDRGILTDEYFRKVAHSNSTWRLLLETQPSFLDVDSRMDSVLYFRVLQNKDFTYALFDQLAMDFNGDMFPSNTRERSKVKQKHLDLLRRFLQGESGPQQNLFFWAYRFDVIPIELISSIYEEFYHVENERADGKGTHYTPPSLVDFIVSQTLTNDILHSNPRVVDAAAGSGIFLVESFRRIVRYHIQKRKGRRLNFRQLQQIIRKQISGIEINEEAVRVAAFSLYLAMLHYQEPPDILRQIKKGHRLPHLIYQPGGPDDENSFNCLVAANAFAVETKILEPDIRRRFTANCADVVIGNPPWGSPESDDTDGIAEMNIALQWCQQHNLPVSDKERSQAFIWRTLDLLRNGGIAGLLISTGVLYKKLPGSHEFRNEWLKWVKVERIVNFAHVRDVFFKGPARQVEAIAPFASTIFKKEFVNRINHLVEYWSAKKTAQVERLQAVVLSQPDLHLIPQDELRRNSDLWKIYWWGNHRDAALINSLALYPPLRDFYDPERSGQGFSSAKKEVKPTPKWLLKYKYLPTEAFKRYSPIADSKFKSVPPKLKRLGNPEVYHGLRLLIKHGITQTSTTKGEIIARVESAPFCFSNSINGIKLAEPYSEAQYIVVLAILWSSLARYYFFLTASKWGMWHFGIHMKEYLSLPIRFPDDVQLEQRICRLVEQLRQSEEAGEELFSGVDGFPVSATRHSLEYELDNAVFDLYKLSESERDLIRDMCTLGIDFFYHSFRSFAVFPITNTIGDSGLIEDLPVDEEPQNPLEAYLYIFLKIWNSQLEPDLRLRWRIISPAGDFPLLALIFSTESQHERIDFDTEPNSQWSAVLQTLENELLFPYDISQIYIDGFVRAVTRSRIIIIKRNERRLWTRSAARDDAEATLLQVINLQETEHILSERTSLPHERPPIVG